MCIPVAVKDHPAERIEFPEGLVEVVVIGGRDLVIRDMYSSDPFVCLSLVDANSKTKTIYADCNPTWNEKFEFLVMDKSTQVIDLKVYDEDMMKAPDFMGSCFLSMHDLPDHVKVLKEIPLRGVESGILILECTYTPMTPHSVDKGSVDPFEEEMSEGEFEFLKTFPVDVLKDVLEDGGGFDIMVDISGPDQEDVGTEDGLDTRVETGSTDDQLSSSGEKRLSARNLAAPRKKQKEQCAKLLNNEDQHTNLGILTVKHICCENVFMDTSSFLDLINPAIVTGIMKPSKQQKVSVEVIVKSTTLLVKETKEVETDSENIEFEDNLIFIVNYESSEIEILVNVKIYDKIVGSVSLSGYEVMEEAPSGYIDRGYILQSVNGETCPTEEERGIISFRLMWSKAKKEHKKA